jgi:exodeoxyribonuclease VIII
MNAPAEPLAVAPAFTPGVFDGMPAEQYFSVEAMSQSGAKKMRQSPLHYLVERRERKAPTPAMQLGTAIHDAVLEPEHFDARVMCMPADAPSKPTSRQVNAKKPSDETVAQIAWWREFDEKRAGRILLDADDFDTVRRCAEAVHKHPAARELLAGATVEQSLFWTDARYKVPCKARLDARNHGLLIDVKSCEDASPEGFAKQIVNFDYHAQGAHYISGNEHLLDASPQGFVFIAVEKEPPRAVGVYLLPGEAVMAGAHLMDIALSRYAEALASGEFRAYADTVETIRLPRWALRFDN